MTENYVARCSSSSGRTMADIYLGSLTISSIVAIWKQDRARRFDNCRAATEPATRLGKSFSGTRWEAVHV